MRKDGRKDGRIDGRKDGRTYDVSLKEEATKMRMDNLEYTVLLFQIISKCIKVNNMTSINCTTCLSSMLQIICLLLSYISCDKRRC